MASSTVVNSTNPNPLWLVEFTFFGSLTFFNAPNYLNNSLTSLAVASNAKFLTSNLFDETSSFSAIDISFWSFLFFSSLSFMFCCSTCDIELDFYAKLNFKAWSSIITFCSFFIALSAPSLESISTNPYPLDC